MTAFLYYRDLFREDYFCASRKPLFARLETLFGPPAHAGAATAGATEG